MAMKVRTTKQTGSSQTHFSQLIKRLVPILKSTLLKHDDDLSSAIYEAIETADFCMFALYRGKSYFIVEGKAINKMVPVDSSEFSGFIAKSIKLAQGKSAAQRSISSAIDSLKNEIVLDDVVIEGAEYNSYLDAAKPAEGVVLDVNDQDGRALLLQDGQVMLISSPTELTFVNKPSKGQFTYRPSIAESVSLNQLRKLFSNLTEEQFYLVLAYTSFILAHPRQQGLTYPMLYVYGSAGTGKTTVVRLITKLLGLGEATVKSLPKNVRDLVATAANDYVLCFDNVSNINNKLSDAFCNVITGGTVADRTLYTNTEVTETELHQPMIMTAISLPKQYDLATRAVFLKSSKPTAQYQNEREIFQRLDAMLPEVQSWLLEMTAKTLSIVGDTESIVEHRASSFSQWVAAFEQTIGINGQSIQKHFAEATEEGMNQQTAEHNPLITSIVGAVQEFGEFSGTPTEVHKALGSYIQSLEMSLPQGWPANANAMSIKLNNAVDLLAKHGVEWFVDAKRGTKGRKATLRPIEPEVQLQPDEQESKEPPMLEAPELVLAQDSELDWAETDIEDETLENDTTSQFLEETQEESDAALLALLG